MNVSGIQFARNKFNKDCAEILWENCLPSTEERKEDDQMETHPLFSGKQIQD